MTLNSEIQRSINLMAAAIETKKTKNVMKMYTADACFLAGDRRVLKGKQEIAGFIDAMFACGVSAASFITKQTEFIGDAVLETGSYQLFEASSDLSRRCLFYGDYILVWKKHKAGHWLIHRDAFSILPDLLE